MIKKVIHNCYADISFNINRWIVSLHSHKDMILSNSKLADNKKFSDKLVPILSIQNDNSYFVSENTKCSKFQRITASNISFRIKNQGNHY